MHSSSLTCESFPGYCHLIFTWLFFFQVIVVEYRLGCYFSRLLSFNIDLVVIFPGYCHSMKTWLFFLSLSSTSLFFQGSISFQAKDLLTKKVLLFFLLKKLRKCNFTSRRATDFHLAKICGGIVAVFVVCNLPRLAIGGFEIWR